MSVKKIIDTSSFQDTKSIVSLKLHPIAFKDGLGSYGTITRNTADMDNMIARISRKDTGISDYSVKHVVYLLRDEIICALRTGQAVDMFGLVTMFFAPDGAIKGDNPTPSSIPRITPRFTASQLAGEIAAGFKVDRIELGDSSPKVDSVADLFTGEEDGTLTAGKAVRISGSALKIGGTGSGIFLVPVAEGAEDLPPGSDESTWVPVGRLVSNKPKTLEFWLPDGAAPGLWRIALRTLFLKGNMERKTAVTSFSKVLRITAG